MPKLGPPNITYVKPIHEVFAQRVAKGDVPIAVYRDLYPRSRSWKEESVRIQAWKLQNKPKIKQRIVEIQKRTEDASVATLLERKQTLTEIVRGRVGQFVKADNDGVIINVDADNAKLASLKSVKSRQVTSGHGDDKETATVTEIEVRDPVAAISELNKMEKVYDAGADNRQLVIILRDQPRISDDGMPAIDVTTQKPLESHDAAKNGV